MMKHIREEQQMSIRWEQEDAMSSLSVKSVFMLNREQKDDIFKIK